MSEKDIEFERNLYRNTSSLILGIAIYITTLGTVNPWIIYGVGILLEGFIVGFIRRLHQSE